MVRAIKLEWNATADSMQQAASYSNIHKSNERWKEKPTRVASVRK